MLAALGRSTYRWRWAVLGVWLALTVTGGVFGGRIFDRMATTDNLRPDAGSQVAERRVDQLLPEGPVVVAIARDRDVYDPPLVESVNRVDTALRGVPGVVDVDHVYRSPGGRIGADNRSILIRVELADGLGEADRRRTEDRVTALLRTVDAPQVLVGGEKLAERAFADQAVRDAVRGESIALVVLVAALVVILGGLTAGAVPLLAAFGAVCATLLGLLGLSGVTRVSEFTVNVVTLLGIGLAVDYSLLLVSRFRREMVGGGRAGVAAPGGGTADDGTAEPEAALAATMATAGRAVLVSGLAVAAAMAGLYAFAEPLLAAMALGGGVVVVLATAAGLTLVPALLAVGHRRIAAPRPGRLRPAAAAVVRRMVGLLPGRGSDVATEHRRIARPAGLLGRLAAFAQRRPGPVATLVCAGLLLLALPFLLGAELGNSDARALPRSSEARQVYEVLRRDFQAGRAEPVVVVVEADPATAEVRDLMNRLNTMPQVLRMQPRPDVPGPAAVLDLTPRGETGGPESRELVRAVRELRTPMPVLVGGPAAELVDYRDSVASRLPVAALVLLASTTVLLFALTGSLVIPVKALLMNVLTLLATLGALVVVFQWGVGASLLGVEPWGGVDLTTPVLLFVFVFGLSMDYEVFLLAAIHEEWRSGRGTGSRRPGRGSAPDGGTAASDRAVLAGITRTGPVVTAAAFCIVIVFLGFLLGGLTAVKEVGFGMAFAVVLDVTVVRGLLLPASMSLLGGLNWWTPAFLRRFAPRSGSVPPGAAGSCRISGRSPVGSTTHP